MDTSSESAPPVTSPKKVRIKIGALAGQFENYDDSIFEGLDEEIQVLFYGKNWRDSVPGDPSAK